MAHGISTMMTNDQRAMARAVAQGQQIGAAYPMVHNGQNDFPMAPIGQDQYVAHPMGGYGGHQAGNSGNGGAYPIDGYGGYDAGGTMGNAGYGAGNSMGGYGGFDAGGSMSHAGHGNDLGNPMFQAGYGAGRPNSTDGGHDTGYGAGYPSGFHGGYDADQPMMVPDDFDNATEVLPDGREIPSLEPTASERDIASYMKAFKAGIADISPEHKTRIALSIQTALNSGKIRTDELNGMIKDPGVRRTFSQPEGSVKAMAAKSRETGAMNMVVDRDNSVSAEIGMMALKTHRGKKSKELAPAPTLINGLPRNLVRIRKAQGGMAQVPNRVAVAGAISSANMNGTPNAVGVANGMAATPKLINGIPRMIVGNGGTPASRASTMAYGGGTPSLASFMLPPAKPQTGPRQLSMSPQAKRGRTANMTRPATPNGRQAGMATPQTPMAMMGRPMTPATIPTLVRAVTPGSSTHLGGPMTPGATPNVVRAVTPATNMAGSVVPTKDPLQAYPTPQSVNSKPTPKGRKVAQSKPMRMEPSSHSKPKNSNIVGPQMHPRSSSPDDSLFLSDGDMDFPFRSSTPDDPRFVQTSQSSQQRPVVPAVAPAQPMRTPQAIRSMPVANVQPVSSSPSTLSLQGNGGHDKPAVANLQHLSVGPTLEDNENELTIEYTNAMAAIFPNGKLCPELDQWLNDDLSAWWGQTKNKQEKSAKHRSELNHNAPAAPDRALRVAEGAMQVISAPKNSSNKRSSSNASPTHVAQQPPQEDAADMDTRGRKAAREAEKAREESPLVRKKMRDDNKAQKDAGANKNKATSTSSELTELTDTPSLASSSHQGNLSPTRAEESPAEGPFAAMASSRAQEDPSTPGEEGVSNPVWGPDPDLEFAGQGDTTPVWYPGPSLGGQPGTATAVGGMDSTLAPDLLQGRRSPGEQAFMEAAERARKADLVRKAKLAREAKLARKAKLAREAALARGEQQQPGMTNQVFDEAYAMTEAGQAELAALEIQDIQTLFPGWQPPPVQQNAGLLDAGTDAENYLDQNTVTGVTDNAQTDHALTDNAQAADPAFTEDFGDLLNMPLDDSLFDSQGGFLPDNEFEEQANNLMTQHVHIEYHNNPGAYLDERNALEAEVLKNTNWAGLDPRFLDGSRVRKEGEKYTDWTQDPRVMGGAVHRKPGCGLPAQTYRQTTRESEKQGSNNRNLIAAAPAKAPVGIPEDSDNCNCDQCGRVGAHHTCCLEPFRRQHPDVWSMLQPMIRHNNIVYDRTDCAYATDMGKQVVVLYPELIGKKATIQFFDEDKTEFVAPISQVPNYLRFIPSITYFEGGPHFLNQPVGMIEFAQNNSVIADGPSGQTDEELARYRSFWDETHTNGLIGREDAKAEKLMREANSDPSFEQNKDVLKKLSKRNLDAVRYKPGSGHKCGAGSNAFVVHNSDTFPEFVEASNTDFVRAVMEMNAINCYNEDVVMLQSLLFPDATDMSVRAELNIAQMIRLSHLSDIFVRVPDNANANCGQAGIGYQTYGARIMAILALEASRVQPRSMQEVHSTLRRLVPGLDATTNDMKVWQHTLVVGEPTFRWIVHNVVRYDYRAEALLTMLQRNDALIFMKAERDDATDVFGLVLALEELLRIAGRATAASSGSKRSAEGDISPGSKRARSDSPSESTEAWVMAKSSPP